MNFVLLRRNGGNPAPVLSLYLDGVQLVEAQVKPHCAAV